MNAVLTEYKNIVTHAMNNNINASRTATISLLEKLKTATATTFPSFGQGQCDESEALHLLIDSFDNKEIENLFLHRFKSQRVCNNCGVVCFTKADTAITCEIYIDELKRSNMDLNKYLLCHHPEIDADYRCNNCKIKGNNSQKNYMTMVPDVLIIQYKKYRNKWNAPCPKILEFPSNGNKLVYDLVSQSKHRGSTAGGHYWCSALRSGNTVYLLNDNATPRITKFDDGAENYMLWYSFRTIDKSGLA
jgi:ubiquitin C-terminal hydrolase